MAADRLEILESLGVDPRDIPGPTEPPGHIEPQVLAWLAYHKGKDDHLVLSAVETLHDLFKTQSNRPERTLTTDRYADDPRVPVTHGLRGYTDMTDL